MITERALRLALIKIIYWEDFWYEAIDVLLWLADWYLVDGDYDRVPAVVRHRRRY